MGLAQRAAAAQPLTAAAGMPVQLAVLSQSVLPLYCLRVANLVSAAVLQQRAHPTADAPRCWSALAGAGITPACLCSGTSKVQVAAVLLLEASSQQGSTTAWCVHACY